MARALLISCLMAVLLLPGACRHRTDPGRELAGQTFAELRTIKGAVTVTPPDEDARPPYPRERLRDDEQVDVPAGGLAWMRRDGGATWLIAGPARLTLRATSVEVSQGRVFVDSQAGEPVSVTTPRGEVELSDARASLTVGAEDVSVYVLRGTARAGGAERAAAGEMLTLQGEGRSTRSAVVFPTSPAHSVMGQIAIS